MINKLCAYFIVIGFLLAINSAAANEAAPGITNFKKRFDQYTWVTAHNGYLDDMKVQLERGVRGFMLDLHPGNLHGGADAYICHTTATSLCDVRKNMRFSDALDKIFLPYLRKNPNAVVTLFLENYVNRENLGAALARVPDLASWVYHPVAGEENWPTLEQMIKANKRLVIFTDSQSGVYQINHQQLQLLKDNTWQTQNYWDLGITIFKHDWSCPSRWSGGYEQQVSANDFRGWNRLFVMNQFHTWGADPLHAASVDNNLTRLERRVDRYCKEAIGFRKAPNYLAVDFNKTGDVFSYAAALTQGGFYFYEANRANADQDTVGVLPAGANYNFKLPARGCENDEIRSVKLRGVEKGTRIMLFDSKSGSTRDDFVIIDVKKTIGLNTQEVVIDSLEKSSDSEFVRVTSAYKNGLDGKVSTIRITKP